MSYDERKVLLHIVQNALIQVAKMKVKMDEIDNAVVNTFHEVDGIEFDLKKAEELLSERNDVADHSGV